MKQISEPKKTSPFLIQPLDYLFHKAEKHAPQSLRDSPEILASLFGAAGTGMVLGAAHIGAYLIGGQEFYNNGFKTLEQACMGGLGIGTALYLVFNDENIADIVNEHPVWTSGVGTSWATSMLIAGYHSADHWGKILSYFK